MKSSTIYISLAFILICNLCKGQNASVLSKGKWVKIGITQTGVYKLDAAYLQKAGFNISEINPQNIKIYGDFKGMLPQANNAPRLADLVENSIYVEGEADTKFDNKDYVLFLAKSPHQVDFDYTKKKFSVKTNIYSDTAFYFLTVSDSKGLRIKDQNTAEATKYVTSYYDYAYYEKDLINLIQSGREWYGEDFYDSQEKTFDLKLSGLMKDSVISVTASMMAGVNGNSSFKVRLNGLDVGSQSITPVGTATYDYKGQDSTKTYLIKSTPYIGNGEFKVGVSFNKNSSFSGAGYLNYLLAEVQRDIALYGNQTLFRCNDSGNFIVKTTNPSVKVWDISNPFQIKNQLFNQNSQQVLFGLQSKEEREFIIFSTNDYLVPLTIRAVPNQNIRNIDVPDLVILCSELIRDQAERLADYRRKENNLSVAVVSPEQIYNEYSSGKQDISAIRDFMKSLYDRNPAKLKYLLLFGDASVDYKKRSVVISKTTADMYIPVYESRESLHPILSYSSDDYYGFLSDLEGEWPENDSGDHTLNIGIGRLPVKFPDEAKAMVDKLLHYETSKNVLGDWRTKIAFVADNGDNNIHQEDADYFSQIIKNNYKNYQTDKLYLDAYPLISLPAGQHSPLANQAINNAISQGVLIMNYNGHGAESGWSEEQILTTNDISNWTNYDNMPLMLTATCQFGRYDDPNQVSGAELAILNAKGGAIGLLTTTRPVYQSTNHILNSSFYETAFKSRNGVMLRLGEIIQKTKNLGVSGVINRNFTLLGDPSMQLAYPKENLVVTTINGKPLTGKDTLKALSKVTFEGMVFDEAAQTEVKNFNGKLQVKVFDKENNLTTLGGKGSPFAYQAFNNVLFEGTSTITNGKYSFSFVVPKDINYQVGNGRIYLYAQNNEQTLDASGKVEPLVGGAAVFNPDNNPPKLLAYLNSKNFKDNSVTDSNPILYAEISDENGLNLATNGLGHEMTAVLNDTAKYLLKPYFIPAADSFQSGIITMPFKGLPAGDHQLTIKIWDTYNNSAQQTLRFKVIPDQPNQLKNVYCFPNPLSGADNSLFFNLEHNRQGDDLTVSIALYNSQGKLIKQFQDTQYRVNQPITQIEWSLGSESQKIPTGMYIYTIFVKSLTSGYQSSGTGRLISVR